MHTQYSDVEFDPKKERANRRKHKISFAQAEQALHDPFAMTTEDLGLVGERRYSTLGAEANGTILVVIHTPRGNHTRLISARKASKGEAEQYYAQGI